MKNADPTIERLLAALRDAEPSAGIEGRILQAMEAREAQASTPFWHGLRPVATSLASALVMIGLLIVAIHQHRRLPSETTSHRSPPAVQRTTQPQVVAQQASIAPRRPGSHRHPLSAVPETQVASFPAPPLPLTEQERLLLRLAHRRDPQDAAMLNPVAQAAQSAKATEQFQQFFGIDPIEMRSQIE